MADEISTYRRIGDRLLDQRTVGLMGCENCAFVWVEERVDCIDAGCFECPTGCGAFGEPLYDVSGESTNVDWDARCDLGHLRSVDEAAVLALRVERGTGDG